MVDIDALDALLPQTQCRQCGFAGCRPYAQALADGVASTDLCVPGGAPLAQELMRVATSSSSLQAALGNVPVPAVAWIDEDQCIGCGLCLVVCPVDAIAGAPQWMHTVIEADCTGCALCIKPCPVECIHLREHPSPDRESGYSVSPSKSKIAYLRQQDRRTPEQHQKAERLLALYYPVQAIVEQATHEVPVAERMELIQQLQLRARMRRNGQSKK